MRDNNSIIIKAILFIYVLYSFMPVVGYYIPSILRVVFALIVLFYYWPKFSFRWLPILIFPVFTLIEYAFNLNSQFFPHLYYVINLAVLAAISYSIVERDQIELSRQLVFVLVVAYIINAITTLYGNIKYPNASRLLASITLVGDENYNLFRRLNIGGFDVIYVLTMCIPLAAIVFKKTNGVKKIIPLSVALLFLFTVIKSEYTTALLFALSSFLLFLFPLKTKAKTIIICGAFLALFALLSESFDLFFNISTLSDSEAIGNRMSDLSDLFQGEQVDEESDVTVRSNLYFLSIKNFLASPIFGNIAAKETIKGGHSFILDNMSIYGLIGVVCLFFMFLAIYKLVFKKYSNKDFYHFAIIIYIVYISLCLLNPQPFIPFVSFALPLFFHVLSKEDGISSHRMWFF